MIRRIIVSSFLISIYIYYVYYQSLPNVTDKTNNSNQGEIKELFPNRPFQFFNREWTPITVGCKNCCYIYSAYHDARPAVLEFYTKDSKNSTFIRVIGIFLKKQNKKNFQCHFHCLDDQILSTTAILVKQISESHEGIYSAYFVLCKLDQNQDLPTHVGISEKVVEIDVKNYVNFISISYPRTRNIENDRNIAVCPGPVFSSYDNALRIAEFIEIYKILGVSKFYIYNASISENVVDLLNFYESQGTVEFLPWNIADVIELTPKVIHHYGLIGCLNDCFYYATLVDNFKYFIHADFDEIIFPTEVDTIAKYLEKYDNSSFHSHVFYNYFFFFEFDHDLSNVPPNTVNKFLYTQAQVTRMTVHLNNHERTKYIAKGDSVIEVGNHFIWQNVKNTKEFSVNEKIGSMHHYRDNCTMFKFCEAKKTKDERARKFSVELWKNVDEVCGKVYENGKCPLGRNVTEKIN